MNKKQLLPLILLIISFNFSFSQIPKVKWYSLPEALKASEEKPRLILVDFYTDWCGWCKRMDAITFPDSEVATYLNAYFYPVKFNAEGYDTIQYNDTTWINKGLGRKPTHDLAIKLLNGKLTYPSMLIMDKERKPITVIPGFRNARELLAILIYLNEGIYKTSVGFPDFEKYFKKTYPEGQKYSMTRSVVKWLTLEEALAKNEKEPRKIFLDFNVSWSIGSTMMLMTTYNHEVIGKYLNEKFYPVKINALTRDTLNFGAEYVNTGKHPSYHQLPYAMLQGKMKFPATIILDENNKMINLVQAYLTPEAIEPILKYFGENAYKKTAWVDYFKSFEGTINKKEKKKKSKKNK